MTMTSGRWKSLGPGLVWAATAIGVSHLVQSTRAGATYGFTLVGVILVALLLKYPFFEFGPRYAAATGESLLEGYAKLGRWTVIVFLLLTICTMFTVVGAVTFVTASLVQTVAGDLLTPVATSAILLTTCALILIPGRYPLLDRLVKIIIVVLTISTLAAVILAATSYRPPVAGFVAPVVWSRQGFAFMIALVGWMPSAIDISVWHSLWSLERAKQTRYRPRVDEALFDFNVGYLGTSVLALLFLSLGALVMYGGSTEIATRSGAFASQLIELYTSALGSWSRPLILAAALTTMFSTTLTCLDAFPRVLRRTTEILAPSLEKKSTEWLYWLWMAVVTAGALLLISVFLGHLTLMVDLATTLSFLTAPILGYFNYRVVTSPQMPEEARPGTFLKILSWAGLVFGAVFGAVFLMWRLG